MRYEKLQDSLLYQLPALVARVCTVLHLPKVSGILHAAHKIAAMQSRKLHKLLLYLHVWGQDTISNLNQSLFLSQINPYQFNEYGCSPRMSMILRSRVMPDRLHWHNGGCTLNPRRPALGGSCGGISPLCGHPTDRHPAGLRSARHTDCEQVTGLKCHENALWAIWEALKHLGREVRKMFEHRTVTI